jgi:hypothetical protein
MMHKFFGFKKRKVENKENLRLADNVISDIQEKDFWDVYNFCKPYTMTSIERMYALYKAVLYVLDNNIEGDFVECGVWRGGSSMLIAKLLKDKQIKNKKLFMFDTFEGMSEPTQHDVDYHGEDAGRLLKISEKDDPQSIWCYSDFNEVNNNMLKTGLPPDQFTMIKGKVEDTIPQNMNISKIALLRLDTDFYESTKHELIHLYPLLSESGVIIIDDYGHWQGCRKAVDEFFEKNQINILLNRIDNTGRIGIKIKST